MTRLPTMFGALAIATAMAIGALAPTQHAFAEEATLSKKAVEKMIDARIKESREATLDADTIGPIVKEYLLANPELLEEVLAALEAKRERDQQVARTEALDKNREEIFRSSHSAVAGNPAGDITLVEFFDYNCGYCKRMLPALVDLMDSDPKLRVVFKEWPVLSEGSAEAARIAQGVKKVAPERYLDFHVELMSQPSGSDGINRKRALEVVDQLELDREAILAASKESSVDDALEQNFQLAEALGLRGTPSYVVGNEVIPGALSFDALQAKIEEARKSGCETC
ncbi:DsbA family protein [Microbaculum marinum]|uniref:DsbA family protein n=1 Tax=Microbaculum marinum TaxID=1764581 RepID=A0AAW9RX51_9HYPH